jgi:hypothetical protein
MGARPGRSSEGADRVGLLQAKLGEALAADRAGSTTSHVMLVLPSYSVSESILSHYGARIPSLEHRYLNAILVGSRISSCEIIYISTRRPDPLIVEYLIGLTPAERRDDLRRRVHVFEVDDGTTRSVAAKLLDRPDEIDRIRGAIGGRPAFIEPWNVTEVEVELALALGVPINGTRPELRWLGTKSEGRRLLARAGVPVPLGREDVRSVDDVVAAVAAIRAERPTLGGVIVKHDDSGAGDGNVVLDLAPMASAADPSAWLRAQVLALPDWYLADLDRGGIVEERIVGHHFSSPSVQVDIRPDDVIALATHEQILGGPGGQVYLGCRFPADGAHAPVLARYGVAVGRELGSLGASGRFSLDFVVARDDTPGAEPRIFGLEINLRKGGTTHPYAALRNVVPGRYEVDPGRWVATDGSERAYSATDNLQDDAWTDLEPTAVIAAVAHAGLEFDTTAGSGVILHMLSGLAIDGRFGLTAIARTREEADEMQAGVQRTVESLAAG